MKKLINKILVLFLVLFLVVGIQILVLNQTSGFKKSFSFEVNSGQSIGFVASRLEQQNLIRSARLFKFYAYLRPHSTIKVGTYCLYPKMNCWQIFQRLRRGKAESVKVVIPEGWNIYQVAAILDTKNICSAKEFLSACFDSSLLRELFVEAPSFEGFLFPDTYNLAINSQPKDIILIMNKRFKKELIDLGFSVDFFSTKDICNIVTMASLIETEAQLDSERGLISAVFYNRLKRKMRLDCDPTVRYAAKNFDCPITKKQLRSQNVYNTYKHKGLPPGPICAVGRSSLIAAVNPQQCDYLYFVAKGNGSHYFSRTLAEHNKAVMYFQRGVKNGIKK